MGVRRDIHEKNRLSWNEATRAHNSHKREQARFLRQGGSTIYPEEIELLGDVRGKELLHLCCNSGQDTLSIAAQLGARVTGVDISDEAIAFARALSAESGIPATFERADVYDWLASPEREARYDAVHLSYGALCWLSDLRALARGIAAILRPDGRIVIMEFHPVLGLFDEGWMRFKYPYQMGGDPSVIEDPGVSDYVAAAEGMLSPSGHQDGIRDFSNPHACFSFNHGLGQIVSAVVEAGLRVESLREYPHSNGFRFGPMRALDERRATVPAGYPELPLMFALAARR
jgi:SAM-dependent methyltransferase